MKISTLLILILLLVPQQQLSANNKNITKDFLDQTFNSEAPKPKRFWANKETQQAIKTQFNPSQIKLSYRYWQKDNTTVWILDEIGKERDITTAIVINNNKVAKVEVLIYRESRGGQVQNSRFTQQYNNKTSTNNFTKEIDSISGATLSVYALNKQVRMALWLNQNITKRTKQ